MTVDEFMADLGMSKIHANRLKRLVDEATSGGGGGGGGGGRDTIETVLLPALTRFFCGQNQCAKCDLVS